MNRHDPMADEVSGVVGLDPAGARAGSQGLGRRRPGVAGTGMLAALREVAADNKANHQAFEQAMALVSTPRAPVCGLSAYHLDSGQRVVVGEGCRLPDHTDVARVGLLIGSGYGEFQETASGDRLAAATASGERVHLHAPDGDYRGRHAGILLSRSMPGPGSSARTSPDISTSHDYT